MEFWRNREWGIREILHRMAVEVLLETKKSQFLSLFLPNSISWFLVARLVEKFSTLWHFSVFTINVSRVFVLNTSEFLRIEVSCCRVMHVTRVLRYFFKTQIFCEHVRKEHQWPRSNNYYFEVLRINFKNWLWFIPFIHSHSWSSFMRIRRHHHRHKYDPFFRTSIALFLTLLLKREGHQKQFTFGF
jgi:hypothetical protein